MRSRPIFVSATLVAFVVFTLVWAAPLARRLTTSYLQASEDVADLSRADAMLTSWMLAWGAHALRTDPLGFFHANIFHPLPWTLAFSESLAAGALLVLPVDVLGQNPVLDDNALVLASFVLLGTGTALLLRDLGAAWPAAWFAGVLVTFAPFRFTSIGHVHGLSSHWMPFALLALHRCLTRGRGAIAVAVTTLLVTLSSVYYAYFFFLALVVFLPAYRLLGLPAAPKGWSRALVGLAVAAAGTLLSLVPYMIARNVYALTRPMGEAWLFSARVRNYLDALVHPAAYVEGRYFGHVPMPILMGLGTLAFMVTGLACGAPRDRGGRRLAMAYFMMALWLALVSLGPLMQWEAPFGTTLPGPWTALAELIPGFGALRVPMRACSVVLVAAGVIAGFAADALWRRARRPLARTAVVLFLVVVGVLESWRAPFGLATVPWAADGLPSVYRWLGAQPGRDAVLEMPVGIPVADATYMVMSAAHWKPLVNGYSGFTPTMSFFRGAMFTFPSPPALRLLHEIGVRWVVLHPARMFPRQAGLCTADPAKFAPYATLAYRDATSCVFEIQQAPPPPPTPPDRRVALSGANVTTSDGTPVPVAVDGRDGTGWHEPIDPRTERWLQLDLPAPRTISRLVLELGPHFGDYLRQWRIETSLDGQTWTTATADVNGMPPLVGMLTDPAHLTQELRLTTPTPAAHLRIVRPSADTRVPAFDLWSNWTQWGVHELELYEPAP
jgi:hypothetical protein